MAGRTTPSPHRYDHDGHLRVVASRVQLTDLLDRVFDAMRRYAIEHPTVLRRTLDLGAQVGTTAGAPPVVRERLAVHVGRLLEAFERTGPQACDLDAVRRQAAQVQHRLTA